jgi:hypothetical protein
MVMKKIIIISLLAIISFSCKKKTDNNCADADLDCSAINCFLITYDLKFRVTDKITGADLVFGTNPRYTTGDIKLYYDAAAIHPINLQIDANAKLFSTVMARNEMWLVIKGGTPYKLNASFRVVGCCSQVLRSLNINGQSLCTCCGDSVNIPVN